MPRFARNNLIFAWVVVLGLIAGCMSAAPSPTTADLATTLPAWSPTPEVLPATDLPATVAPTSVALPTRAPTPSPVPPTQAAALTPAVDEQLLPVPAEWPTHGWQRSTPEEQGIDSAILAEMLQYLPKDPAREQGMMGIVVIRHGYLVLEAYFAPYDETWRDDIFSCTKSVTSMLVGIALEEGLIESLDQRVLEFFPERSIKNLSEQKRAMTVEDLLTMRTALDWQERDEDYEDLEVIFQRWIASDDWVQFVLDRPTVGMPGEYFNYNTGASHLLSAIIQGTAQMATEDYAREHLFEPLGITDVSWLEDPQGIASGGYGLLLTPRDMAKLGYLFLRRGEWDGEQVVPAEWVDESTREHTPLLQIDVYSEASYGYQWWIYPRRGIYAAHGYKGQSIFVVPEQDVVAVFTQWGAAGATPENTLWLLRRYVLHAVRSEGPLPPNPEALALLEAELEAAGKLDD